MHLLGEVKRYCRNFRTFELELKIKTGYPDAGRGLLFNVNALNLVQSNRKFAQGRMQASNNIPNKRVCRRPFQ